MAANLPGYILNQAINAVIGGGGENLEELARELGVLGQWEEISTDEVMP